MHIRGTTAGFALSMSLCLLWSAGAACAQDPLAHLVEHTFNNEAAERLAVEHIAFTSKDKSSRTGNHVWIERTVEFRGGILRRLVSEDGVALSPERAQREDERIAGLVSHPDDFKRTGEAKTSDEKLARDLVKAFPKAFVFTRVGKVDACTELRFEPNPAFVPASVQERVLHSLAGTMLIKEPENRLCEMEGKVTKPVSIGFGVLGRVEQDSSFKLVKMETAWGTWVIEGLTLQLRGRMLLFKSLAKDQDEQRTSFKDVPVGLSLAQAALLTKE